MERAPSNQAATIGGIVLVGLGLVFLLQQAIGFDVGHFGWPLFVILPGLALLAAYALGPRGAADSYADIPIRILQAEAQNIQHLTTLTALLCTLGGGGGHPTL